MTVLLVACGGGSSDRSSAEERAAASDTTPFTAPLDRQSGGGAGAFSFTLFDDAIADGFDDRSTTDSSAADTDVRFAGAYALSVTMEPAGKLYLGTDEPVAIPLTGHLRFMLFANDSGPLSVVLVNGDQEASNAGVTITPVPGAWQEIVLPLERLGSTGTMSGVWWQEAAGRYRSRIYVDDVRILGDGTRPPGPLPDPDPGPMPEPDPNPNPNPEPEPEPEPGPGQGPRAESAAAARFLTQATFGPDADAIAALRSSSTSAWFRAQLAAPRSDYLATVESALAESGAADGNGQPTFQGRLTPNRAFWEIAVGAEDQLRQRMVFALSQILVISNTPTTRLWDWPVAVAHYQDILSRNALGNYRDLLEAVTYSPAMGEYLTYLQNTRGDPVLERIPDENYAREIMQLFTTGLVQLTPGGRPVQRGDAPVEIYDNDDVSGLARVFTGLSLDTDAFFFGFAELNSGAQKRPMRVFPEWHSGLEKRFLGTTIPAGTPAAESIDIALDALVAHPNVPPFIARQLIQRFVDSAPAPSYVTRVAEAFRTGTFTLPDGARVGDGRRGDLAATVAAVLFDPAARDAPAGSNPNAGKLREPVLRITHWARAFGVDPVTFGRTPALWNTAPAERLAQGPFQSPSVFNYYRPGHIAPGTLSGEEGLTVPELQIVSTTTVAAYANFVDEMVFGNESPRPDYTEALALAGDPRALVEYLDLVLLYDGASDATRNAVVELVSGIELRDGGGEDDGRLERVRHAVFMLMTSPDYVMQR